MADGKHGNHVSMDIEGNFAAGPHDENMTQPLLPLAALPRDGLDERVQKTPPIDRDRYWAIAFKVNVFVTFISAAWFGISGVKALMTDSLSSAGRHRLLMKDSGDHDDEDCVHPAWNIVLSMGTIIAIVCVVGYGILHSLIHCARGLIFSSYGIFAGIWGLVALLLAFNGSVIAVVPATICAVIVFIIIRRKHRIAFAAANLKVAFMALKTMPWTFRSAMLMGVVQFLWSAVAAIAAMGSFVVLERVIAPDGSSYQAIDCFTLKIKDVSSDISAGSCMCNGDKISDEECEFSGLGLPLMVVWLLSLSWGCAVITNVVACTTSGSVASWWFKPNEDAAPVKGAFYRATHSSFGSLCKAAAVQKVIAVITAIANRVLRFIPCASTLLRWVNVAVKYALAYTVAFIGIYGLDFNAARSRVRDLFQRRGVTTLTNDVTVEFGLALLAFSGVMVYLLVSFVAFDVMLSSEFLFIFKSDNSMDTLELWSIWGPQLFGIFTCLFLISTVLELARSGHKAVFVCFTEDPNALAQKHDPKIYQDLNAAWTDRLREQETVTGTPIYNPAAIN